MKNYQTFWLRKIGEISGRLKQAHRFYWSFYYIQIMTSYNVIFIDDLSISFLHHQYNACVHIVNVFFPRRKFPDYIFLRHIFKHHKAYVWWTTSILTSQYYVFYIIYEFLAGKKKNVTIVDWRILFYSSNMLDFDNNLK